MEWWTNMGAYAQFFGDLPALAVDFATKAPSIDVTGAHSAYAVQSSQVPMPLYDQGSVG